MPIRGVIMAIPDFQILMLPVLRVFADGQEHSMHDYFDQLTEQFSLTELTIWREER
jgi:restriction system protein